MKQQSERGVRICEKNNSADTKASEEGGEEVLQALEQRFPCSPWKRSLWGRMFPCSPWMSTVEQISTCSPWRTPCQSKLWSTAAHRKDSAGAVHEEGTSRWSRGRVWGVLPLRRKERQRQRVKNWLQHPFPIPLHRSGGGGREIGSVAEPGKKGGVVGRCFKSLFYFSLPYSDLIGNKLN